MAHEQSNLYRPYLFYSPPPQRINKLYPKERSGQAGMVPQSQLDHIVFIFGINFYLNIPSELQKMSGSYSCNNYFF